MRAMDGKAGFIIINDSEKEKRSEKGGTCEAYLQSEASISADTEEKTKKFWLI